MAVQATRQDNAYPPDEAGFLAVLALLSETVTLAEVAGFRG